MPHLSPQTLTQAEQRAILRATAGNPRNHLIYSLALGTDLRLAEIVGMNVGDVYTAALREARFAAYHDGVHPSERSGTLGERSAAELLSLDCAGPAPG